MKNTRKLNIKNMIYQHIVNNSKEYILVTLIFIIGIFLGVMFINNTQEAQLLKSTVFGNLVIALMLWFFGTTVIRNTSSFWSYTI